MVMEGGCLDAARDGAGLRIASRAGFSWPPPYTAWLTLENPNAEARTAGTIDGLTAQSSSATRSGRDIASERSKKRTGDSF
jgi:hypothetical protein